MSSALEPQMFEDVSVEPQFVPSAEVAALAVVVAGRYDEHALLAANLREQTISIAYVWETKPFDPAKEEYKPHTIALVRKAPTIWRCLTGYDLVVQFRRWFWDHFTPEQREAVMFHELAHVGFKDGGLELRHHDLEEFNSVVRHFGPAIPGRRAFLSAFKDWEREQLPESSTNVDPETGEILDGPPITLQETMERAVKAVPNLLDRVGLDADGRVESVTVGGETFGPEFGSGKTGTDYADSIPDLCVNAACDLEAGHSGACEKAPR